MPKFRFEYNGNPEYCTIHVTCKLTEQIHVSSWDNNELIVLLKGAEGVTEVSLRPYSATLKYGLAFSREQVLLNTLELLKLYLEQSGQVNHNDIWEQLPTYRQDILMKQCPECQAVQDAEMRDLYRDTLELD